jgi:hypothetical protein
MVVAMVSEWVMRLSSNRMDRIKARRSMMTARMDRMKALTG